MVHSSNVSHLEDNDPLLVSAQKYLGQKALSLRIVEEFLTQIELSLLKEPGSGFDLGEIRAALAELKDLGDEDDQNRRKRVEFQLAHELQRWQDSLAARDERIEAYSIRRYCDGLRKPMAQEVFLALARFYRDIPRSKNSLSKFDLALTRAFSTSVSDLHRALLYSRAEIAERLQALYCSWDRVRTVDPGSPRDESGFDKFIGENERLLDFRSLTASRLFDRIREFKSQLGDRFWDPAVAAAAVECNIIVGNHLNGLMARVSENLGERLGSDFDFAGALQDTSPNAGAYVSDALREIGEQSPELLPDMDTESEDLRFLRSLLELSDSIGTAEAKDANQDPEAARAVGEECLSVDEDTFRQTLLLLEQHNPDVRPLAAFASRTDLGGAFELDDFLFGEDQQPDSLGRDVLRVIFSLECLRQRELHEPKQLPILVRNKVVFYLGRAEALSKKIEEGISARPETAARRLRIANRLLEARLRTERSIIKFTSRGLGETVPQPVMDETPDFEKPTIGPLNYASTSANRWLVAATICVVLATAFVYTATGESGAQVAEDVEKIAIVRLPGSKGIASAHRQGNTLYVVATNSWREKSDKEKSEALKEMIHAPTEKPISKVLVVGEDGTPLGELGASGVQLISSN